MDGNETVNKIKQRPRHLSHIRWQGVKEQTAGVQKKNGERLLVLGLMVQGDTDKGGIELWVKFEEGAGRRRSLQGGGMAGKMKQRRGMGEGKPFLIHIPSALHATVARLITHADTDLGIENWQCRCH